MGVSFSETAFGLILIVIAILMLSVIIWSISDKIKERLLIKKYPNLYARYFLIDEDNESKNKFKLQKNGCTSGNKLNTNTCSFTNLILMVELNFINETNKCLTIHNFKLGLYKNDELIYTMSNLIGCNGIDLKIETNETFTLVLKLDQNILSSYMLNHAFIENEDNLVKFDDIILSYLDPKSKIQFELMDDKLFLKLIHSFLESENDSNDEGWTQLKPLKKETK